MSKEVARHDESVVTICVSFLDGEQYSIALRRSERIEKLRRAVARALMLRPNNLKLHCGGHILSDERTIGSLPGTVIMAWTRRYTAHRSEEKLIEAEEQREHSKRQRERKDSWEVLVHDMLECMRAMIVALWKTCSPATMRGWLKTIVWIVLLVSARYVQFGMPFLIASAMVLMFQNLGTRRAGEASAYTVFNNFRALPGQLQLEDLQREILQLPPRI
uniref:Ubiquitin-like domain-containing protein n=1 Tax=Coccolithus braarudii TaxID=221442 RepID=A0A7S0LJ73_9EUKA|mmetsp:Transcript_43246/g.92089  ORF Transcript_43246/g.92089 Transcript_43246/m.92089 type:complete len:218 (+) Transcript_43246:9-662(+)